MDKECIENTITMRLECNNFNIIDKKKYEEWINWIDISNRNSKINGIINKGDIQRIKVISELLF